MFTLTYPDTGAATITVSLRNPEFEDSVNINSNILNRDTRHGENIIYKNSNWPTFTTRKYVFTTLNITTINDLTTFFNQTAGLKIKITDYNSNSMTGFIVTSENEIVTMKDDCSYDVSFEFMEN